MRQAGPALGPLVLQLTGGEALLNALPAYRLEASGCRASVSQALWASLSAADATPILPCQTGRQASRN
jgi:hypothetical protein